MARHAQDLIKKWVLVNLNESHFYPCDVMNFLIHRGMDRKHSFFVMENVRKGKGIEKRNKQGQATTEFEAEMRENNIPEWFIESCKKISYLSHGPMR